MSLFLMLQVIIHTKRKERTKRKRRYQKLQNPSPVHQERFITFCLWLKLHWNVFSIRHRCTLTTVWWQFNYHNTFNIDYTCEFVTLFSFFFFLITLLRGSITLGNVYPRSWRAFAGDLNTVSEIQALWSKCNFYYIGCRTNIYIFGLSQWIVKQHVKILCDNWVMFLTQLRESFPSLILTL